MPITDFQLEQRKKHIGSSDTAAILGLNPWRTAYDVWLEKSGQLAEGKGFSGNEATDIGKMIEDGLLDWAAAQTGLKILKNQYRVHAGGILSATHDALAVDKAVGYEAKTAGIVRGFAVKDLWGEEGSDQIPEYLIIQCQHQMAVSDLELVHVPALIGGRGRVPYVIRRNDELIRYILEKCQEFWEVNVKGNQAPEGLPNLDIAKIRIRTPGKTISLADATVVLNWRKAKDAEKQAKDAAEEAERVLYAAIGDAEIAESDAGNVTIKEVKISRIDSKLLKEKHPEIATEVTKESTYKRIYFKEAK